MARPREFEEADVVARAMDLFWTQGYQATSVADLVAATGLQRGSLYGAFGDKKALFLRALDAYAGSSLARFQALVDEADDPVDGVRAIVRLAREGCTARGAPVRGCLIGTSCTELAAKDEVVRERLARFFDAMRAIVEGALARGREAGTLSHGRDPAALALLITTTMQGMNVLAATRPGDDAIASVTDQLLTLLD